MKAKLVEYLILTVGYIFLTFSLCYIARQVFVPKIEINPYLQKYYDEFMSDVKTYCPNPSKYYDPDRQFIYFVPKLGKATRDGFVTIGQCTRHLKEYDIEVRQDIWDIGSELDHYELMTHELTHCVLGLGHVNNPHHYMNSSSTFHLRYETIHDQLIENIKGVCK